MKRLEQMLNTSDEIMTNSCAAVVSHISSILRSAERLNKKREINTQIGYRNEMSPVSTCKAFTVWTSHHFTKRLPVRKNASARNHARNIRANIRAKKARQITLKFYAQLLAEKHAARAKCATVDHKRCAWGRPLSLTYDKSSPLLYQ